MPRRSTSHRPAPIPREDVPAGACLCDYCVGKCCRYFSLPFAEPETWPQHDVVARYLEHGQTLVYLEKGTWYLVVTTRCGYLGADYRCGVYHDRPKICREYTTADCEYDEDWSFTKVFETPAQFREYAEATLVPRKVPAPPSTTQLAFAMTLDPPATRDDYDSMRWFLAHGQTLIYVRRGVWCLAVTTPSTPFTAELLRDLDSRRLQVDAGPGVAADDDAPFDRLFEAPAQLWEYAQAVLPPPRKRRFPEPPPDLVTLDPVVRSSRPS